MSGRVHAQHAAPSSRGCLPVFLLNHKHRAELGLLLTKKKPDGPSDRSSGTTAFAVPSQAPRAFSNRPTERDASRGSAGRRAPPPAWAPAAAPRSQASTGLAWAGRGLGTP